MTAYYNEIDPYAAQWLRNLISNGFIAPGDVDERSIVEVKPDDLKKYKQCHFFAGIGGWSLALRLAGWSDDRPVWTGSCPCQPFSTAGKQKGKADERHLWPVWFNLIRECRPATVFGEQVSSAIAHGWLDEVADDLETEGYAIGEAIVPACSVGASHKRDRLWFVADAGSGRFRGTGEGQIQQQRRTQIIWASGNVAESARELLNGSDAAAIHESASGSYSSGEPTGTGASGSVSVGVVGVAHNAGSQGRRFHAERGNECSPWASGVEWIGCGDGKQRLVKSGLRLLANGVPGRVGKLRAYGNAIVPQVAAEFIRAFSVAD